MAWIFTLLGGPGLFLLGTCLFDYVVTSRILWSRSIALLVLAAIAPAMLLLPPLGIMIVANLVLLITLVGEMIVSRRRPVSHLIKQRR